MSLKVDTKLKEMVAEFNLQLDKGFYDAGLVNRMLAYQRSINPKMVYRGKVHSLMGYSPETYHRRRRG